MDKHPDWKRLSFKGNKVWIATDEHGEILLKNGKARLKYNLNQEHEYWVKPENLKSNDPENLKKKGAPPKKTSKTQMGHTTRDTDADTLSHNEPGIIHLFTDGASSGNPGPSGIGVLLRYGDHEKEISKNIGNSTNNIAELEAIRTGLLEIKKPEIPVRIYTDSSYALGLLSKGWKPKKNQELVESIKEIMKRFRSITLVKVKGHSGIRDNERADQLATSAIPDK